jgi:Ca-activated chloride channel family protein
MRKAVFLAALASTLIACAPPALRPPAEHAVAVVAAEDHVPAVKAEEIVSVEAAPANRFLKADQRGEMVVRLRLGAKALREARRPPINLGLVIDTSGSMEGDAIRDARAASLALLDSLAEGDRLAVVSFNSDTEVLVPSTVLDKASMARIRTQLAGLTARGTTDLAGGLRAGLNEVTQGFQASGINRVVLLGDGVPNDERPIAALAQEAAQKTIPVTVMGLGLDYNETLMNTIAQSSGGHYHFIKESSKVASVFKDEVLRLKQVVARNAILRLVPGPGVTIKEVIGLPTSPNGSGVHATLGDLGEGEQRDVLVRLDVSGRRAGAVVELIDAELSFEDAARGPARLAEKSFLGVRASQDASEIASGRDLDVERSAARALVSARIVQAIALARAGQLAQAQSLLDLGEKEAKTAAKTLEDSELDEKARSIPPLRRSLPSMVEIAPPAAALYPGGPVKPVPMVQQGYPMMPKPAAAAIVMDTQAAAVRALEGR